VYTEVVKNITLSADEHLIERAREVARSRNETLNAAFREWLRSYTQDKDSTLAKFDEVMARLQHINAGRKFTRDEMNER
jgi:hypothetical protein